MRALLTILLLVIHLFASIKSIDVKEIEAGARVVIEMDKLTTFKKVQFNNAQSIVFSNTLYTKNILKKFSNKNNISAVRVIGDKKKKNTYVLFESSNKLVIDSKNMKADNGKSYLIVIAKKYENTPKVETFKGDKAQDNTLKSVAGKSIVDIDYTRYLMVMGVLFLLVIALIVFRNRINRGSNIFGKYREDVKLIDSRYIDNKNKIMNIRVKDKNYIVLNNENGNLLLDREYYENEESSSDSDFDKIYGNAKKQSDEELHK